MALIRPCVDLRNNYNEILVSEHFDKPYATLEEFQKDIFEKITEAIKQIEDGKGIPMEDIVAEMEAKYNL